MRNYNFGNQVTIDSKVSKSSENKSNTQIAQLYSLDQKRKLANFEKAKENIKLAAAQLDW